MSYNLSFTNNSFTGIGSVTVTLHLKDENDSSLTGETITLSDEDNHSFTGVTDSNGDVSFNITKSGKWTASHSNSNSTYRTITVIINESVLYNHLMDLINQKYYNKIESDGRYLTSHQDISGKLSIAQTSNKGKNVVVDKTTGNITFEDKPNSVQDVGLYNGVLYVSLEEQGTLTVTTNKESYNYNETVTVTTNLKNTSNTNIEGVVITLKDITNNIVLGKGVTNSSGNCVFTFEFIGGMNIKAYTTNIESSTVEVAENI